MSVRSARYYAYIFPTGSIISSGVRWNWDSSKETNTATRYVSLSFIIPMNFEYRDQLKSPIHFLIVLCYDIWPLGAWAACALPHLKTCTFSTWFWPLLWIDLLLLHFLGENPVIIWWSQKKPCCTSSCCCVAMILSFVDSFLLLLYSRDEWRKAKESGDYKTLLKFLTAAFDSFADINAVFKVC